MEIYKANQQTASSYHQTNTLMAISTICFPILIILSICIYKKYRSAVRRKQIQILEESWKKKYETSSNP
ncbi:MAG: hypothetical protein KME60_02725 [Cyanomargarita calcarea GSE-NOS-MK-12-04C]|jgi:cytochrome bd-type quinol oxidase subunit 2|uniref:Uncharacterized protein n=1 Tax=Cyanomargarita calcarea GSE-NOS-MK-12-04C TaxID=2839659 RepID=A0A951URK8_9CYAN|nr:hypothetical protein [Cyanomargarita calcarea GSE-NOS-MK-12-04C]